MKKIFLLRHTLCINVQVYVYTRLSLKVPLHLNKSCLCGSKVFRNVFKETNVRSIHKTFIMSF